MVFSSYIDEGVHMIACMDTTGTTGQSEQNGHCQMLKLLECSTKALFPKKIPLIIVFNQAAQHTCSSLEKRRTKN